MEIGDLPAAGLNPEAITTGDTPERLPVSAEAGEQKPGQVVIKESFCLPWAEDPATFDPDKVGWKQATENVLAKIQEMLAAPEVTLTPDGLTPKQAAAKEQAELAAMADARAARLAEDLAAARSGVEEVAAGLPPAPPVPVESPAAPEGTKIDQLVEALAQQPAPPAENLTPTAGPASTAPRAETNVSSLDQLLEQVPAEMRKEIEQRLAEFGEGFDEDEFSKEHQEEYAFINQVISESGDLTKTVEAAGKVRARLEDLDKQEDGGKKKKDFLVNLFGIYKRRLNQEKDPAKREELKKSMLGLNTELVGLGIGSLGGILEVIIGIIVGEIQEQLK